jgi:deoxyribodipyrimidine photo-lyase
MNAPVILWFRQDLRLRDNPALHHAIKSGTKIIPIYILDDETPSDLKMGGASRVWLHHSLSSLSTQLDKKLHFFRGDAAELIPEIIKETGASGIYWNRCYEPWRIKRDTQIKSELQDQNIEVKTFNASLLWEPWEIETQNGTPYKVFTPFYKKGCLQAPPPPKPQSVPKNILLHTYQGTLSCSLDDLELLPQINWDQGMVRHWNISENGAQNRLNQFLDEGLEGYAEKRNLPIAPNVSRLSPYLHFGEISPHDIWYTAQEYAHAHAVPEKDIDTLCSELGWREFSYHLLYHFPDLHRKNLQEKFNHFPWSEPDKDQLSRWQKGQTGYPIIDAAMRELWQTGYMHNRCRMIVASFLVKNMLVHWHYGEDWFWDCLFDADLASNSASWQWVAGCGADAAPYFRIFNPILQGEKFDPDGQYIKKYVPELQYLPTKYIHTPWEAPKKPKDYPAPMLDIKATRQRALDAYEHMKECAE